MSLPYYLDSMQFNNTNLQIGLWRERRGEVSSLDQVDTGPQSYKFLPGDGKGHQNQLSLYENSETNRCRTLLHAYSSLHLLLPSHHTP